MYFCYFLLFHTLLRIGLSNIYVIYSSVNVQSNDEENKLLSTSISLLFFLFQSLTSILVKLTKFIKGLSFSSLSLPPSLLISLYIFIFIYVFFYIWYYFFSCLYVGMYLLTNMYINNHLFQCLTSVLVRLIKFY